MKPENITETDWQLLKKKYPKELEKVIEQINNHYPVQYLIGNVEFYNCLIKVDERALIPRFETEFLVEKTLQKLKELNLTNPRVLDIGTGSGCIAIALKKNYRSQVTAIDISKDALELAKENAQINKVDIHFQQYDLKNYSYEHFDVIISNPPYVAKNIPVGEETKYEPQKAIFAEKEGMYFYEEIIKNISQCNDKPKLIALEIGYEQSRKIVALQRKYLSTYTCVIEKDLSGKPRYAFLTA